MKRQVIFSSFATAIVLAALSYFIFGKSDVERLDDLVRSGVPIGSTKQQVYDFLNANAIRSSPYNAGPDPLKSLPDELRGWRSYVEARVPKYGLTLWSPDYTIHVVFYFDMNYRVTEYKVEKIEETDSF